LNSARFAGNRFRLAQLYRELASQSGNFLLVLLRSPCLGFKPCTLFGTLARKFYAIIHTPSAKHKAESN